MMINKLRMIVKLREWLSNRPFYPDHPAVLLRYESNKILWFYLIVLHPKSIDYFHSS